MVEVKHVERERQVWSQLSERKQHRGGVYPAATAGHQRASGRHHGVLLQRASQLRDHGVLRVGAGGQRGRRRAEAGAPRWRRSRPHSLAGRPCTQRRRQAAPRYAAWRHRRCSCNRLPHALISRQALHAPRRRSSAHLHTTAQGDSKSTDQILLHAAAKTLTQHPASPSLLSLLCMAEALLLAFALVVPSVAILVVLEASTPSPVFFHLPSLSFRRHAPTLTPGPKSWARHVADEKNGAGAEAEALSQQDELEPALLRQPSREQPGAAAAADDAGFPGTELLERGLSSSITGRLVE